MEEEELTYDERLARLPVTVREYLYSPEMMKSLETISRLYGLHVDQLGILEAEVSAVMLGITEPNLLTEALTNTLDIPQDKAQKITEDINLYIFSKARELLKGQTASVQSVATPSTPTPAPVEEATTSSSTASKIPLREALPTSTAPANSIVNSIGIATPAAVSTIPTNNNILTNTTTNMPGVTMLAPTTIAPQEPAIIIPPVTATPSPKADTTTPLKMISFDDRGEEIGSTPAVVKIPGVSVNSLVPDAKITPSTATTAVLTTPKTAVQTTPSVPAAATMLTAATLTTVPVKKPDPYREPIE